MKNIGKWGRPERFYYFSAYIYISLFFNNASKIDGIRCGSGSWNSPISQSKSATIGAPNIFNNELATERQAPANLKFGKMRDNLLIESRTTIKDGPAFTTDGPKAGMSFLAENFFEDNVPLCWKFFTGRFWSIDAWS